MNLLCDSPRSKPPQLRVRAELNGHVVDRIHQFPDLLTAGCPGCSPIFPVLGFLP